MFAGRSININFARRRNRLYGVDQKLSRLIVVELREL